MDLGRYLIAGYLDPEASCNSVNSIKKYVFCFTEPPNEAEYHVVKGDGSRGRARTGYLEAHGTL